jgi:hypothetical protein
MMPPHFSSDSLDEILAYTAVVANALQDVAIATQIPFLDSVSTLSLSVIPIVQVRPSGIVFHLITQWNRSTQSFTRSDAFG